MTMGENKAALQAPAAAYDIEGVDVRLSGMTLRGSQNEMMIQTMNRTNQE